MCRMADVSATAEVIAAGSSACQMNNPASVMAWATTATGGGVWGPGGVASDGTNLFVITGNTFGTGGTWGGRRSSHSLATGSGF